MPAMPDDPTAAVIYRVSGEPPYPTPGQPSLPESIYPRQVTLRDRITLATLLPFASAEQVPPRLLAYLSEQLNREIEKGDTYPMITSLSVAAFGTYWFQNFGAIMVLGEIESIEELLQMEQGGTDWSKLCLGSFYVKPNYPGRSSHICNGGFLVTDVARNKGVGRLMGEIYLEWAPQLGYSYSVFNLVYETNVASCRIWDALGFKRIGRIKAAGALRSHPDELIDGIIYGRDLGPEGEDFVSEERFDKIRYYLKHSKYPAGADRAEKSRLRSAATHYKLVPNPEGGEERLMLKDKEVVADPQRQYEIARQVHVQTHGGINKTTASIAERYHWVRIKETVSLVIKNCPDCKESNKPSNARPDVSAGGSNGGNARKPATASASAIASHDPNREIERLVSFDQTPAAARGPGEHSNGLRRQRKALGIPAEVDMATQPSQTPTANAPQEAPALTAETANPQYHHSQPSIQPHPHHAQPPSLSQASFSTPHPSTHQAAAQQHPSPPQPPPPQPPPSAAAAAIAPIHSMAGYEEMPLDPQMMSYTQHGLAANSIGDPRLAHPGLPAPTHTLGESSGMGSMGHPMNDAAMGRHAGVEAHGAMPMDLSMGGMAPHHGAFDLGGMAHPGGHGPGLGMAAGLGDGDHRMDGAADGVTDGDLGRQLLDAGYGGRGHAGP